MTVPTSRPGRWRRRVIIVGLSSVLAVSLVLVLLLTGTIWPNRWFASGHPVKGVDVSTYQGTIDWAQLSSEGIDFAYIKATEGSTSVDDRFAANWKKVHRTKIVAGAYHFLSLDSSGTAQARNIHRTVPHLPGDLPIAIDVECYGSYCSHPPARRKVDSVLDELLTAFKKDYGYSPVLYADADWYNRYLAGGYRSDPIWIRSVILPPGRIPGRSWTFWQWSDREKLSGYNGRETFIDMNAFSGDMHELHQLVLGSR